MAVCRKKFGGVHGNEEDADIEPPKASSGWGLGKDVPLPGQLEGLGAS